MSEQRTPDVSKIDHGDSQARDRYMMAFDGAINHFNYDRYQLAIKLAIENVCADFERDGLSTVSVAYFDYKLHVALWDIYFGDLGNDKPACPWTARPVQNDPNDEPADDYIDWRRRRGMADSAQSQMDVSANNPVSQEGDSQYPASLFESLQRVRRQAVNSANVAAEMGNIAIETHKSMEKVLDEKRVLQEKVASLEEELARVQSERNSLRCRLRDATFTAPRRQPPSSRQ
ncbi:hypothetical protein FVEG_06610 [Fusarium verticillioides 7600]|uniref:Uncharacterized protein n=1 Tax=Gibberella moniliformis (strain M3125 / FGSC 7600) TaxID=334819 RepID=W7M351_GIBM7|nr:hypothetical protein FVEG_06610 [Fusarium verticillioides 7600]EWG45983.1 hypothetical protein FVEG_06610 [Fusarium verticillioides 7600]RBQ85992.1 hypothetical protein FVER53263_06610 [Fusarium verticillioides]RBR13013.1 hypothetical protein FVER53590_06610 [Fusarium verticillioides]